MSWLDNRSKSVLRVSSLEERKQNCRHGMTPLQWKELREANERKAIMGFLYGIAKVILFLCLCLLIGYRLGG